MGGWLAGWVAGWSSDYRATTSSAKSLSVRTSVAIMYKLGNCSTLLCHCQKLLLGVCRTHDNKNASLACTAKSVFCNLLTKTDNS